MDDWAAVLDFFDNLRDRCDNLGQGTRCFLAPHLRVVWVLEAVPAEISGLLLGPPYAAVWGPTDLLNKGGVIGFFSRQEGVLLEVRLH
jgi:hypothetical protein